METLSPDELSLFKKLSTPQKIQDYINTLAMRKTSDAYIVRSPRIALKNQEATCMEGALLAAAIFEHHGYKPYLLDLKVAVRNTNDVDHVVAIFKINGFWGAISKTSHAVLRYREPIYKSVRELALSYFHEYFTDDGKKNLRSYSKPFDVSKYSKKDWVTTIEDLYELAIALDDSPHSPILTPAQMRTLRLADSIEIEAGKITDAPR